MDQFDGSGGGDHPRGRGTTGVDDDVEALRATARRIAVPQAAQLRLVARVAKRCTAAARAELAGCPPVWGRPSETGLIVSLVTTELMVALGISDREAEKLWELGTRLVDVLPATLAAVEAGRIDLPRARVLSEATEQLDDQTARAVEALVLPAGGDAPWERLSPRQWRTLVHKTVTKVDADAVRRRREQAIRERAVRAWWQGDGTGVLQIVGVDTDIVMADRVITDLAEAWPYVTPDGTPLAMDQRRVDAPIDLLRRVGDGAGSPGGPDLPRVAVRRERKVGIVLHADTLFADGPAADDPGELRGLGAPAPLDPTTAREIARAEIAAGAGTRVLLVGGEGGDVAGDASVLQRAIRLPQAPPGGWTPPRADRRRARCGRGRPAAVADRGLRPDRRDHRARPRGAPAVHVL